VRLDDAVVRAADRQKQFPLFIFIITPEAAEKNIVIVVIYSFIKNVT